MVSNNKENLGKVLNIKEENLGKVLNIKEENFFIITKNKISFL